MLRPIEPIEPGLSTRFLTNRTMLSDAGNVVEKHDYALEAARDVSGLAPYLECWQQHRQRNQLPQLDSFDVVRRRVEISGVHLVETPSPEFQNYRFISFDTTTSVSGDDLSGTYIAEYPDRSFREAARLDYTASVASGEGRLTVLDVHRADRSGKLARLVLPLSDDQSQTASRLLVIVQLLEHRPSNDDDAGLGEIHRDSRLVGANQDEIQMPGFETVDKAALVQSFSRDELVFRYFQSGIHEQLDDGYLLEWLLRNFLDPKKSRILATQLISEFGSLAAVLAMGRERLADFPGLTLQALVSLKVVRELATRLIRTETMTSQMVSDARQVVDYCRARMAHETVEHLRVLYLDQKNRLIRDETFHGGGVSSVIVNPRQIVKRAILLDAQSIIMAHNHPSGDPSPSAADVEVTRDVKRAAEAVEIRLLDHLIIGRSGSVSLRTLGYLDDH